MRFLLSSLCITIVHCLASGNVGNVDFSRSHSLEQVLESGLVYTDFTDRGRFIRIREQDISLKFPGHRIIDFRVRRGSFHFTADGILTTASLYTELMPPEEAAGVMRAFMRSLGQSDADVDRWLREVGEGKHYQPFVFKELATGTGWSHYPAISMRAKSSMNPGDCQGSCP